MGGSDSMIWHHLQSDDEFGTWYLTNSTRKDSSIEEAKLNAYTGGAFAIKQFKKDDEYTWSYVVMQVATIDRCSGSITVNNTRFPNLYQWPRRIVVFLSVLSEQ